jgi:hypothetical protein
MDHAHGVYFVIATDDKTGIIAEWKSERGRPQADSRKVAFEKTTGLEKCTVRIEFKVATQVSDFIKALERTKVRDKK